MTKQKQLKRRVRSRMQKTGERYAAARRHVVKESAPEGKTSSAIGPEAFHVPGRVPATSALRVLLGASGVVNPATGKPYSEALAFGIAGGIGAGMCAFHYEEACVSTFFVAGRHLWQDDQGYLEHALARFGLRYHGAETNGKAKAREHLERALGAGGPVIAWVDHAHLPHRAAPDAWKGGGYHVVTVYRADEQAVLFGDLCAKPIAVERDVFELARARIKKQKTRVLWAEEARSSRGLEELLREGLAACVDGLTRARMKAFTLRAFDDWADALHGSQAKNGWQRMFPRGRALWQALVAMHDFIEHYGTGGGLMRPLYGECFAEAARQLGAEPWRGLAKRYAALGRGWSELADAALPDDVPAFRRAKELARERAKLVAANERGGPERVRAVWEELDELAEEARTDFPLTESECDELRAALQTRLRVLCSEEAAALEALRTAAS